MAESKFVISLDFELHWGVFDTFGDSYNDNILGARKAVPQILALFQKYDVKATWATVGLLFNESYDDYETYKPASIPAYQDTSLNPFNVKIGTSEVDDKLHFANSLIKLILDSPGQELASHSYSHYYCISKGQTAHQFELDIQSAVKIAKDKFNADLKSFVFPKNQVNEEYLEILSKNAFSIFRGSYKQLFSWRILERMFRFFDSFVVLSKGGTNCVHKVNGIKVVYADRFLRPYKFPLANKLMLKRIKGEMVRAAKGGSIYHLWWHPHNFGKNLSENLDNLEQILISYSELKDKYQMRSVCMRDL